MKLKQVRGKYHTANVLIPIKIDVHKLFKLTEDLPVVRKPISWFEGDPPRSRESGFTNERYRDTDLKYPLLVTADGQLVDGRHRLCRLLDRGRRWCRVKVVPYTLLEQCALKKRGSIINLCV